MRLRQFLGRVVWNSVLAVLFLLGALVIAMVYPDELPLLALVLVGGAITFAILAHRS